MICVASEKASKNEVNFIGLRSYIHRLTKLTSSAFEVIFMKRGNYASPAEHKKRTATAVLFSLLACPLRKADSLARADTCAGAALRAHVRVDGVLVVSS